LKDYTGSTSNFFWRNLLATARTNNLVKGGAKLASDSIQDTISPHDETIFWAQL
jgi:hypothetical protein